MRVVRESGSDDLKIMETCFLCKEEFRFGQHVYLGQPVKAWDIMLCTGCIKGNREGIVAEHHPDLIDHLKAHGIEIKYYANGCLAWPEVHALRF